MRAFGIWASGLLAALIVGAVLGNLAAELLVKLGAMHEDGGLLVGVAGALAFTCVRLWAIEEGLKQP